MTEVKAVTEKTRYTNAELEEFRQNINEKLQNAQKSYEDLRYASTNPSDTMDTAPTFKVLEEGSATLSKEENSILMNRELRFIKHLQSALTRIENKTYGICYQTGKLIPVERLISVPHATLLVEAKNLQNNLKKK